MNPSPPVSSARPEGPEIYQPRHAESLETALNRCQAAGQKLQFGTCLPETSQTTVLSKPSCKTGSHNAPKALLAAFLLLRLVQEALISVPAPESLRKLAEASEISGPMAEQHFPVDGSRFLAR